MSNVYIIGSYSTRFQKWPELTHKQLTRDCYLGLLADAGMTDGRDIESAWFGNCSMAGWGQPNIRGQVCFIPLVREGLFPERVPIINVEGACATASMAMHGAWKDILSGQAHLALAIGVEKLFHPDASAEQMKESFRGGMDNFDPEETVEFYRNAAEAIGTEFAPRADRTFFMDTYAMQARYHMSRHGTTERQIASASAKSHHFGSLNDKAQYRFDLNIEQVLADRMVTPPLTRSMCAPIGDGAAAALLCSEEYLHHAPEPVKSRAIRLAASVFTGGKYRALDEPGLSHAGAARAYQMAGIAADQVDVAEVHDATSFCEIYQSEMLGFCPVGQGGAFIESGCGGLDGKVAINTSGGLVSKGHPVGATGLSMIYELVTQLRGEAGARQRRGAEWALQQNGGGLIGFEEAVCSVTILHRDR